MHTKLNHLLRNKDVVTTSIVALIIGIAVGYAGAGVFSHPAVPSDFARGNFTGGVRGGANMMRGGNGGEFLTGTVAAKDAGSVTLNTRDGSSHVVLVTPATTVSKSVNGTLDDVTNGATIIVSGTINSDGSVSANLIQLRPDTNSGIAPATGR